MRRLIYSERFMNRRIGFTGLSVVLALILSFASHTGSPAQQSRTAPTADVDTLNAHASRLIVTNPDTALKIGFRAVRLALKLDYLSGHTRSLLTVGKAYYRLSKYKKALEYFTATHTKATERKQDPEASDALYFSGRVYFEWGDYDQSLQYFFNALSLGEKIRDTMRIASTLNSIGDVYEVSGNLSKALRYYRRSLKHFLKINHQEGIAATYNHLGMVYYKKEELDQALRFYNQAMVLYRQMKDEQGMALTFRHTGDIEYSRQEYSKSLTSYFRALQREQKAGNTTGTAVNFNSIARSYAAMKQYDRAVFYYEKAIASAGTGNASEQLMQAYQGLATSFAQVNDFRKAFNMQQKYLAVRDSVSSQLTIKEIAEVEARFELQSQRQEVELLRKEKKIQAITLERNRQLNYLMGVLSVLLLILGLVYLNRYIIKRRANRLLSVRNQIIQAQNRDLQTMNEKLKASEGDLQNLLATKDKFFTIISHDLRGPLHSLTGMLQILINHIDGFSRDELRQFAISTDRTVRNLRNLLENLLEWSRTQRSTIHYRPEAVAPGPMVQEIYSLLEVTAVSKKIAVFAEIPDDLIVFADRNMLHFVLRNLIDNSIKFTGAGGKVWVTAASIEDKAEITVSDTGIGIPPEDIPKLFRVDTYHSTTGTANETGTGLGLIICNEFIARHGGTLEVNSQPGSGTAFRFNLPVQLLVDA